MIKTLATLLAGAVAATVMIVACSDDSPSDADAAVCDCPAAEAPLAGRVMRVRGLDSDLPANSGTNASASCPAGALLLSGWCEIVNMPGTPPQAAIVNSGSSPFEANTWQCTWRNYSLGSGTTHAEAVCLMPAL